MLYLLRIQTEQTLLFIIVVILNEAQKMLGSCLFVDGVAVPKN